MSDTTVGLEIDGSRVTVVESLDGLAVSSQSVSLGSLDASLAAALEAFPQKKNSPPVRVAVLATGVSLRRIDVTRTIASSRDAFEDAVFDALPAARESSAVAGVLYDADNLAGDMIGPGVAVVMPQDQVEAVYRALGERRAEVVPAPLLLSGFDGVWLGLHLTCAEATLLRDGRPVAYRQLRAGGLGAVAAVLGDEFDPQRGMSRLLGSLTRSGQQDALADAEVARYLRMVAGELRQTIEFWGRQGEQVDDASQVCVYGVGGSAPAVRVEFAEHELSPVMPPALLEQLAFLPPAVREEAILPGLASASVGEHLPLIAFPNAASDDIAAARARRRRRLIQMLSAVAVVGLLTLMFGYPLLSGFLAAQKADTALATAQAQAGPLMPIYYQTVDLQTRDEIIASESYRQVDWPRVIELVYGTRPEGARISRFASSVDNSTILLVVEAEKAGGTFDEMSQWIDRLVAGGATQPWSPGFAVAAGLASYQITLDLPLDQFRAPERAVMPAGDGAPVEPTQEPVPQVSPTPVPTSTPAPEPSPTSSAPAPSPSSTQPAEPTPSPSPTSSPPSSPSPAPSATPTVSTSGSGS